MMLVKAFKLKKVLKQSIIVKNENKKYLKKMLIKKILLVRQKVQIVFRNLDKIEN